MPESFAHLPEGMLPMCYPADHYDGVFIPNWALWFVIQLEEYQTRSGDQELVDALKPRLEGLYEYFQKFTNEDGLLESLESWIFVEWSQANNFVQDVSYPTNMLYAAALAAAGKLYNEPDLLAQSEQIRAVIRRQSFEGEFFVDNAVRKDGVLEVTRNRTEVCQYFAFFFDVATPQTHESLWEKRVGCRDCHLSEARTVTVPVNSSRLETHAKTEGREAASTVKTHSNRYPFDTSSSVRRVLTRRFQPGQSTLLRRLMDRPIPQFPSETTKDAKTRFSATHMEDLVIEEQPRVMIQFPFKT